MARRIEKIFITGGSGFIGKNLKEYLHNKYIVFAPTRKQLDLLDQKKVVNYVYKNKIDLIIHAAIIGGAKTDTNRSSIANDNLRMFFNIVSTEKLVKKILYCGSGLEYDKSKSIINVRETAFRNKIPPGEYGLYKYIAAKYCESSKNVYDLVIFGIFGKYEGYLYKFISNSIVKNILGLPIKISQNVNFSYLYVDDFCRIVNLFIKLDLRYRRYNIVPNKKIDLLTIARIINEIGENKSKITIIKKGLNNEYTASNQLLLKEIKNFKFTDYKQSLAHLYEWYESQKKEINLKDIKNDLHLKFIKKVGSLYI